ncbi:hypothetical protein Ancab_023972 [Ancistrocladus abbreviatus]
MKADLLCTEAEAIGLLKQLEDILERDPLIDEVGFIHPSQLLALNEEASPAHSSGSDITQAVGVTLNHELSEGDASHQEHSVFWNRDHKLGISTHYLLPLYKAAKCRFEAAFARYKISSNSYPKRNDHGEEDEPNSFPFSEFESEVMKHSKALLLLSSNFGTAWNSRKLIGQRKQSFSIFVDELHLSSLVLSFAPKTENAWSHRRWVIKMIAGKRANLQEILEKESELVEKIAEKSKMNYRAWNHRSWLVAYMPSQQVLHELKKSRNWAGLHVADNSCFHYRRRLMLRMLDDARHEQDLVLRSTQFESLFAVWKEELEWNEILIRRYVGREALWHHRRFLSICWAEHFTADHFSFSLDSDENDTTEKHLSDLIDHELQLLQYCSSIPDIDFEDVHTQAGHGAAYFLWLSKEISRHADVRLEEKLPTDALRALLNKVSPEKSKLWACLLGIGGCF